MADNQRFLTPIRIFRFVIVLVVVVALAFTIYQAVGQLGAQQFEFSRVDWRYWILAILAYSGAMFLSSVYWFQVLRAMGQRPAFGKSVLAFFASQFGKYVPGKAMVIVIRTDMIRGDEVGTAPAAASVFVETLTWIFVGSAIACVLLAVQFRERVALMGSAIALTVIAGVLIWPPVFRLIAKKIISRKSKSAGRFLNGLDVKTVLSGWVLMGAGWCLNGLSLWLVLAGISGTQLAFADFPLTLACVTLATVAGFVSLLPGGIGVREVVMMPLLGSRFGMGVALVAVITIRLVWLVGELFGAGIIYLSGKRFGTGPTAG